MKAIRMLSATFVVLALALAGGCQTTGDSNAASGSGTTSSGGGY
jgi:hypothetical protein